MISGVRNALNDESDSVEEESSSLLRRRFARREVDRQYRKEDAVLRKYTKKARTTVRSGLIGLYGSLLLSSAYVWHDGRRHKRSFLIGTTTVFVVVCVLATLQATLGMLPHIFLKIAEDNVGEMDFVMTPHPTNSSSLSVTLNSTDIRRRVAGVDEVAGFSPRWYIPTTVVKYLAEELPPLVPGLPPRDILEMPGIILAADGKNEAALGVGRAYPDDWQELKEYEAVVAQGVADSLGLWDNERFAFRFDISSLSKFASSIVPDTLSTGATTFGDTGNLTFDVTDQTQSQVDPTVFIVSSAIIVVEYNASEDGILLTPVIDVKGTIVATGTEQEFTAALAPIVFPSVIELNYTVKGVAHSPWGKWPAFLGNVAVIESTSLPNVAATAVRQLADNVQAGNTTFQVNALDLLVAGNVSTANLSALLGTLNATTVNINGTNVTLVDVAPLLNPFLPFNLTGEVIVQIALQNGTQFADLLNNTTLLDALNQTFNVSVDTSSFLKQAIYDQAETIETFPLEEFAMLEIGMIDSKRRMSLYLSSPKKMYKAVTKLGNSVMRELAWWTPSLKNEGLDPVLGDFAAPLAETLNGSKILRNFLDMIFFGVIIMLVVLSCLVIYSLLLDDVQTKTYEYGMLRALGLPHHTLALLLLLQASVFAVPGTILGLAGSWGIILIVYFFMTTLTNTRMEYAMPLAAGLTATGVGLFMPVAANILPIRNALKSSLRQSLDIYHGRTAGSDETSVSVRRLTEHGLNPGQTLLSVLLVGVGMTVYYVIPYAFVYGDTQLLLRMMTLILLGMIVGLAMIALIIHPFVANRIPAVAIWGWERKLKRLVKNNLYAHRARNLKTATIFMLALSYILFVSAMFVLQENSLVTTVRLLSGSDLVAVQPQPKGTDALIGLPVSDIRSYLESEPLVDSYCFFTFPLTANPWVRQTYLSNLVGFQRPPVQVFGIESSFGKSSFDEYVKVTGVSDSISLPKTRGIDDPVLSLYVNAGRVSLSGVETGFVPPIISSPEYPYPTPTSLNRTAIENEMMETYTGYVDLIMSEALSSSGIANAQSPLQLRIKGVDPENEERYVFLIGAAHATVSKLPGFFYSSYGITARGSSVLVSVETYGRLLEDTWELMDAEVEIPEGWPEKDTVPMQRLLVRMRDGSGPDERRIVSNGVLTFTDDDITVQDTAKNLRTAEFASRMLQYFFNIVAALSVLLGAFSLWLSFTANVRENSWEYGVLRSIGVSGWKLMRTSVYEALILTAVALILGTIIGVTIAVTLTLQFNLFLENRFQFDFPWTVFTTTVSLVFLVSILGSATPSVQLFRKGITSVLRGMI